MKWNINIKIKWLLIITSLLLIFNIEIFLTPLKKSWYFGKNLSIIAINILQKINNKLSMAQPVNTVYQCYLAF